MEKDNNKKSANNACKINDFFGIKYLLILIIKTKDIN